MHSFRLRLASVPAPWALLVFTLFFCVVGLWLGSIQELSEHETVLLPGSGTTIDVPYTPGAHHDNLRDSLRRLESNGLCFYAFLLGWLKLGWRSAWQLRLPCLIAGTLCLPVLYSLGRHWRGTRLGLCAAFLFGANALTLASVAHLRFYAFAMLFELLFVLSLHRAWEQSLPGRRGSSGSWRYVAWAALWGTLAMFSMALSIFLMLTVLAVYSVASGWHRRNLYRCAFLAIWLGLCALFLHCHDTQALDRVFYASVPWWEQGGRSLFTCGFERSHVPDPIHEQFLQTFRGDERLDTVMWAMLVSFGWAILAAFWQCRRKVSTTPADQSYPTPFLERLRFGLICAPLIAAALLLLFSHLVRYVWNVPNLYFVLPFVCLSLGYGLAEMPKLGRYAVVLCMVWSAPVWGIATYIDSYGEGLAWRTLQAWRRPTDYVLVRDSSGNWWREPNPTVLVPKYATDSALELVLQMMDVSPIQPGQTTFVDGRFLPKLLALSWKAPKFKGHRLWVLEKATERMSHPKLEEMVPAYFGDRQHDILCHQFGRERLWLIVDHRP